jgi:polysaccharide transporter, PST family
MLRLSRAVGARLLGNGIVGNAASLYAVQGINYLIPLALLPYLLRLLSPDGYGVIMLAQSLIGYALILTEFGFNLTAARDISVARHEPEKIAKIYWTTMAAKTLLMSVSLVILGIVILATPTFRSQWPVFAASGLLVVGNVAFPQWYFQGLERLRDVAVVQAVSKCLVAASVVLLVHGTRDTWIAALVMAAPQLAGAVAALCLRMPLAPPLFYRPTAADIVAALRHSGHVFASILSTTLYLHTNTVVLGLVSGAREVALYSIGTKLVGALQSLASPLIQAVFPRASLLFAREPEQAWALLRRAARWVLPVIGGAALFVGVFAPFLVRIIGGPSYADAATVLRIMAAIPLLVTIAAALSQIVMINIGLSKQLFRTYLGIGCANLLLLAVLVPAFAARGAAAALLIAETVGPIMMIVAIRKSTERRAIGVLIISIAAAVSCYWPHGALARAPELLRTPGYESPVQGGPDDLLLIAGNGFSSTDRVVYEAIDAAAPSGGHPSAVPADSTPARGIAPIVKLADPPYSITTQLPGVLQAGRGYHLWVVTAAGEWSAPVSINDPRPLWITPAYVYSSADFATLGRQVRVVGRNLAPTGTQTHWIQLQGPGTYVLPAQNRGADNPVQRYVAEATLPDRIAPGMYAVATSRDGHKWTRVPTQQLEVRPDPVVPRTFTLSDPSFGGCKPDDGADDTACLVRALEAAREAGGGIVRVPRGRWDVSTTALPKERQRDGLILARGVQLRGDGASVSTVIRHAAKELPAPGALLTLVGNNSVLDLSFTDAEPYESLDQTRTVIQLGLPPNSAALMIYPDTVEDVVISGDTFNRVGRAVVDGGRPIRHLFVTHNEFGAYDNAMYLTGGGASLSHPYRLDDSVFRWNRFVPGSYLDVASRQGTVATQVGAASRVDFSSNVADGTSVASLQDGGDVRGWRAAFFWNLTNNMEELLIANNQISCSGDKAGDGEALSFDGNRATFGFDAAQTVAASGADWITIARPLLHAQFGQPISDGYYDEHWLSIVDGPGLGQTRHVVSYTEDRTTGVVRLRVSPGWDIVPQPGRARVILGKQFWQVYVVANEVEQGRPPCQKSNFNGPRGGVIAFWAPVADSTIEANRQIETDGIEFLQDYSARTRSCPNCVGNASIAMALEIRNNEVVGEYDWSSDCSWSGIRGYFVATPTPEEPPPILGFGTIIAHNMISHADGQRGGAISLAHAGAPGPAPGNWPMVQSLLIFGNVIRDINGELPRFGCPDGRGQLVRAGIRIEGPGNVRDAVLEGNRCENVATLLEDSGKGTQRVCRKGGRNSCECGGR